jgi:hypothetical protein
MMKIKGKEWEKQNFVLSAGTNGSREFPTQNAAPHAIAGTGTIKRNTVLPL